MLDSISKITLKLHFCMKTKCLSLCMLWTLLHNFTKYGLSNLMHGVKSLPDAVTCDKSTLLMKLHHWIDCNINKGPQRNQVMRSNIMKEVLQFLTDIDLHNQLFLKGSLGSHVN